MTMSTASDSERKLCSRLATRCLLGLTTILGMSLLAACPAVVGSVPQRGGADLQGVEWISSTRWVSAIYNDPIESTSSPGTWSLYLAVNSLSDACEKASVPYYAMPEESPSGLVLEIHAPSSEFNSDFSMSSEDEGSGMLAFIVDLSDNGDTWVDASGGTGEFRILAEADGTLTVGAEISIDSGYDGSEEQDLDGLLILDEIVATRCENQILFQNE